MPKPDFSLKFIKDGDALERLSETLMGLPAFALDIETTDWWNRHREQIALIQIAFRAGNGIKVFIIDALAQLNLSLLRRPLEEPSVVTKYHLIFCPKYRYRVLTDQVRQYARESIEKLVKQKEELEIIEMNVQPDHVHLFGWAEKTIRHTTEKT
jgi:hypothetical protein